MPVPHEVTVVDDWPFVNRYCDVDEGSVIAKVRATDASTVSVIGELLHWKVD